MFMILGPGGHVRDPQNHLFMTLETPEILQIIKDKSQSISGRYAFGKSQKTKTDISEAICYNMLES